MAVRMGHLPCFCRCGGLGCRSMRLWPSRMPDPIMPSHAQSRPVTPSNPRNLICAWQEACNQGSAGSIPAMETPSPPEGVREGLRWRFHCGVHSPAPTPTPASTAAPDGPRPWPAVLVLEDAGVLALHLGGPARLGACEGEGGRGDRCGSRATEAAGKMPTCKTLGSRVSGPRVCLNTQQIGKELKVLDLEQQLGNSDSVRGRHISRLVHCHAPLL